MLCATELKMLCATELLLFVLNNLVPAVCVSNVFVWFSVLFQYQIFKKCISNLQNVHLTM